MVFGGALTMGIGFGMEGAFGTSLIQLGLFAVVTGLSNLLAEPPEFEDFREIDAVNKRESYLFNGPINTYNPGGPVPMGYGRLLVGSATVGFAQENRDKKIYDNGTWYPVQTKQFSTPKALRIKG
jgi:predicted phage tail protein